MTTDFDWHTRTESIYRPAFRIYLLLFIVCVEEKVSCGRSLPQIQQLNYQSHIKCEKQKPHRIIKKNCNRMSKDSFCLFSKVRTAYIALRLLHTCGIVTYFYQLCTSIVILIAFFSPPILFLSPSYPRTSIRFYFVAQSMLKRFFSLSPLGQLAKLVQYLQRSTTQHRKHNRVIIYFGFPFIATIQHRHEVACTMHSKCK